MTDGVPILQDKTIVQSYSTRPASPAQVNEEQHWYMSYYPQTESHGPGREAMEGVG